VPNPCVNAQAGDTEELCLVEGGGSDLPSLQEHSKDHVKIHGLFGQPDVALSPLTSASSPVNTPSSDMDLSESEREEGDTEKQTATGSLQFSTVPLPSQELLIDLVIGQFQTWKRANRHRGNKGSNAPRSSAVPSPADSGRSKKRQVSEITGPTDSSRGNSPPDEAEGSLARRSKRPRHQPGQARFACPYWKADSMEYSQCYHFTLSRISDVKQHLRRCHFVPHCSNCGQTFPSDELSLAHGRSTPACVTRQFQLEMLSNSQKHALEGRPRHCNLRASPEQQWYIIWDIIFPDTCLERPSSPYLDSDAGLAQYVADFNNFWDVEGRRVTRDVFEGMGAMPAEPSEADDWVGSLVMAVRERIGAEFLRRRAARRPNLAPGQGGAVMAIGLEVQDEQSPTNTESSSNPGVQTIAPQAIMPAPIETDSNSGYTPTAQGAAQEHSSPDSLMGASWDLDNLVIGTEEDISYDINMTLQSTAHDDENDRLLPDAWQLEEFIELDRDTVYKQ
jgi:hypothetical protein